MWRSLNLDNGYLFNRVASVEVDDFKITDLRITFDISKHTDPKSNKATITITNLSQSTRSKIKEKSKIVLKAGYEQAYGEQLLFAGFVTNFNHEKQPTEIITTLECVDGIVPLNEANFSLSYAPGTSVKKILADVMNKMKVNNQVVMNSLKYEDVEFTNGVSYVGNIEGFLNYICQSSGLEWSFQNNTLTLKSITDPRIVKAIELSPETGLIGSPEHDIDIDGKAGSKNKADIPGWKIKALLQPSIEPGSTVIVTSREIPKATKFVVFAVDHKGDTHGSDWVTSARLQESEALKKVKPIPMAM
jgi:hypothetical protein